MAKHNFPEQKKQQSKHFEKPRVDYVVESDTKPAKKPVEITSIEDKPIFGVVSGCNLLNIRNKPNISGQIVGVISAEETVRIDMDKSTDDWYFVTAQPVPRSAFTGYCMRKYISLAK